MPACDHSDAITIRSGTLRPDEELLDFEAAWCPKCKAFREASATSDPEPWLLNMRQTKSMLKKRAKEAENDSNLRRK